MTFSTFASPGVGLQGGGGSGGGGTASLPISGNGATITTSTPLINGTQTWNSGATTFTSLLLDVTDTASAAASLLMDLQVGGSSRFNVGKTGSLKLGVSPTGTNQAGTNVIIAGSQGTGTGAGGSIVFQVAPAGTTGTAQNALATALTIDSAARAAFTTSSGTGVYINDGAAGLIYVRSADTQRGYLWLNTTGGIELQTTNNQALSLGATTTGGIRLRVGAFDSFLHNDAANTLALRNGANAQTFRVYNTWTSFGTGTEIWERGKFAWESNVLRIGTEKGADGGTARALEFQTDGTTRLTINTSGDSTFTGTVTAGTSGFIVSGRGRIESGGADGRLVIRNSNTAGFDMFMFGGANNTFPALKRVSANLQVIAADNSGSAGFIVGNQALATNATDGFLYVPTCAGTPTGTPTAQTGTVPIVVDTTNNKLYFYSNAAWRDAGP